MSTKIYVYIVRNYISYCNSIAPAKYDHRVPFKCLVENKLREDRKRRHSRSSLNTCSTCGQTFLIGLRILRKRIDAGNSWGRRSMRRVASTCGRAFAALSHSYFLSCPLTLKCTSSDLAITLSETKNNSIISNFGHVRGDRWFSMMRKHCADNNLFDWWGPNCKCISFVHQIECVCLSENCLSNRYKNFFLTIIYGFLWLKYPFNCTTTIVLSKK